MLIRDGVWQKCHSDLWNLKNFCEKISGKKFPKKRTPPVGGLVCGRGTFIVSSCEQKSVWAC